jgi:predicted branched-subunit amino acid permease
MVNHSAMAIDSEIRAGLRAAVPIVLPTLALGASFGVLAQPVMGSVAPIVMSILVFSGGAQFAVLGVLVAGGGATGAATAGLLMNARWLPMSFAIAPSLRGRRIKRVAESQAIVDASFVLADRGDGTFSPGRLIGATIPQASSWVAGTILGVVATGLIPDPDALGLDAVFPAFYLALLLGEMDSPRARATVAVAAVITLALMPWAPAGVPVIAAAPAALLGLRR